MNLYKHFRILTLLLSLYAFSAQAQDSAIGYWESHLPYANAIGLATDGNTIFTIGSQAFYTFKPGGSSTPEPYSKTEGMSDVGMQCIGYDVATSTTILVYANGNIDLYKNNTFYNIPDLKTKTVAGIKQVYQVYTENGFAYLSTSLGIIVVDLTYQKINQTYTFINPANTNNETIAVKSFISTQGDFYAATTKGVYRIDKNSNQIQNYMKWQLIDSTHAWTNISSVNNTLYLSTTKELYTLSAGNALQLLYTTNFPSLITHIDAGYNKLFVSEYDDTVFTGRLKTLDQYTNTMIDSIKWPGKPLQVIERMDSSIWIADYFLGLQALRGKELSTYVPAGPADPSTFDVYAHNKQLYIVHGGYTAGLAKARNNNSGIDYLHDGRWTGYTAATIPAFRSMQDFVAITKDETNGTMYAGSFLGGLFVLNSDYSSTIIKESVFDSSSSYYGQNQRQIVGLDLDKSRNLWVTTYGSEHLLYVKTVDSQWYKFDVPGSSNGGQVVAGDDNKVWFACLPNSNSGGGVSVLDHNGTIGDPSDDNTYHLSKGAGAGNLPSNGVFCIAKDKNNNIWVGTDNGICIVSNCSVSSGATTSAPCDAEIPIVQYDKYAGYLFAGSAVKTIAVDGGNRKWVGTDAGVWLLSPDASKIIYRFTEDNSPLPSNRVQKITVDDVTGDVYIGTEMGLVCYRSTATAGGTENKDVLVFPNPVKSDYKGEIAIKGLVNNADVKITDIAGHLVYHTTAFGGQAMWNGTDYTGRRPQSGVYLIFASSADGTQTYSGKVVFIQ